MADGRHNCKSLNRYISTKNHQLLMKFGTQQHIKLDDSYVTKYDFFLNSSIFCFPKAARASASGGFRIVSDTLVICVITVRKWFLSV